MFDATPRSNRSVAAATLIVIASMFMAQTAHGQFDIAVHGDRMMESEMHGLGATLLVPIKEYSYDIALGSQYYFARDDSTSAFAVDLDAHTNLFVLRFLRPYTGIGMGYFNRDGRDRLGLNLKAGVYVYLGNRLVPYVQYIYRTIPSNDNSHIQAGFRILVGRQ